MTTRNDCSGSGFIIQRVGGSRAFAVCSVDAQTHTVHESSPGRPALRRAAAP